jgi:hypothetical protein
MISKFSLAKALFNQAKLITDNNSLLLIPNGKGYEPDPNTTYIQEFVLYGPDNSIGLADCSNDIQLGVYQLNINTPKAQEGAKWRGLQIGDILQAGFARGTELIHNSQMVRMKTSTLIPMDADDTHEIHILNINFSIIN